MGNVRRVGKERRVHHELTKAEKLERDSLVITFLEASKAQRLAADALCNWDVDHGLLPETARRTPKSTP